jgi:hypothetical protein
MQTIPPSLKKGFYGFFFKKKKRVADSQKEFAALGTRKTGEPSTRHMTTIWAN